MKKNTLIYLTLIFLGFGVTNCDDIAFGDGFLEKGPGGDVTLDTIFSSQMYAERALNSAYATLRTGLTLNNPGAGNPNFEYQNAGNKLGWDNLDALTDIIHTYCNWGGVSGSYYNGTYSAETENESVSTKLGFKPDQDATWTGIRKAFLFINNVDRVPDMTSNLKTRRKGEARMIIACHYHELLRHFGGIPILTKDVEAGNENMKEYVRQPVEKVVDYIVQLCDQAATELDWKVDATDDGRFTKAAAMALKIRVLQLAASPIFNATSPYMQIGSPTGGNVDKFDPDIDFNTMVWYGDYQQNRWKKVVDACKEFIEANESASQGSYKLVQATNNTVDAYREAFSKSYADRYNDEILIATCRTHKTFGDLYHRFYFGPSDDTNGNTGRGYGGGCITLNYVDMFPQFNGEKTSYQQWIEENGSAGTLSKNPFVNRDPRLYEAVMIVGDKFQGRPAEMWVGGRERGVLNSPRAISGFNSRKFFWDYNEATFHYKPANYAYMRLAEVYLIYAEALNETGDKPGAYTWLNKVRNRVGLPNMGDALLKRLQDGKTLPVYTECSLIGDPQLREEILDERAREFSFEEVRWFDIVRWKRADIFKKDLYSIVIMPNGGSAGDGSLQLTFSQPEVIIDRYWKKNFSAKWYFSAFPSNEVNKGYGLIQNPGW